MLVFVIKGFLLWWIVGIVLFFCVLLGINKRKKELMEILRVYY